MKKILTLASITFLFFACKAGPDYVKPASEESANFKESLNWQQAAPKDEIIRDKWWEVFNDPELNKLEEQLNISNQNIKAAEAAYRQASALVLEARASYLPTISAQVGTTRNKATGANNSSKISNNYSASLSTSWELDLWGRIRRTLESNTASVQASAADLELAKLSAQAQLATNYFDLRISDEQKRLFDSTVSAYTKSLAITQNQYNAGIVAKSDLLQAQTQLNSTLTGAMNIEIGRAILEHAIAISIGKAPANFSIESTNSVPSAPNIPVGIPSDLLERRPDIASAERLMAAANAKIGIAKTAYYPNLTLSASGGYESSSFVSWISAPSRLWSVGPSLIETLFDGGLRKAQTKAAIAAYDGAVATYRQTVLNGFREVEDNLVTLRILEGEASTQGKAVMNADKVVNIFLNQYKSGIINYTSVIIAQTSALNNKQTALNITKSRLDAVVALVKALGGGWVKP